MSTEHEDVRRLLDACRPGSEDLGLPEMRPLAERLEHDPATRELYERTQQFDSVIKAAMFGVDVPDGLDDRILAALSEGQTALDDGESGVIARAVETAAAAESVLEQEANALPASGWWRYAGGRKAVAAVLSVAAVAVIFAFALVFRPGDSDSITADRIYVCAEQWATDVNHEKWRPTRLPVRQHPLSRYVRSPVRRWQTINGRAHWAQVVCYDLTASRSERVHLFVVRVEGSVPLPDLPPQEPRQKTQGWCIGCWQEDGTVYALVAHNVQLYERMTQGTPRFAQAARPSRFLPRPPFS